MENIKKYVPTGTVFSNLTAAACDALFDAAFELFIDSLDLSPSQSMRNGDKCVGTLYNILTNKKKTR